MIHPKYLYQPPKKGCRPVLALWGRNRHLNDHPSLNVMWPRLLVVCLSTWPSTLIALAFYGYRFFDPKVLYQGSLTFDWVWKQRWPHGKRWFISLMTEVGYPILYHFSLILGVFSHLAPDVIYKSSRVLALLECWGLTTWCCKPFEYLVPTVQFSIALFYCRPWWKAGGLFKRIGPRQTLSLLEANVFI